ncbi:Scr1 family TA system antitoxin-like transcriptional regulator [Streptomyces sp. NPDC005917]|uniref:Scr1 family TA system antitoxin-like transcriptional regulator n=1 Tax=unclassified Streptomyces TaxID=2593676 RepID=UPI0033E06544
MLDRILGQVGRESAYDGCGRHATLQPLMPTDCEDHAGMGGSLQLLKLRDGKTLGHLEVQFISRLISDPSEAQTLEKHYGMIRAQALMPQESLAFIEKGLEWET